MKARKPAATAVVGAALAVGASWASPAGSLSPPARTGYAPVNGLRVYYEIHGRSEAGTPPLVLLHGGGSSIETSFGATIGRFAETREVIAFDQQGHGRTADIKDRPFTFGQSAEDAVALLRYLEVGKADLLGYSNGGHIAIEIALRHPEVVRRLVLVSAMVDRSGCDPAFWEGFTHTRLDQMPAELREAYVREAPHPEDLPTFFTKSVQRMLEFKGWTPKQIGSIAAPTLVVVGDRDIVRPEHAVRMVRLIPDARLAVLPDTDHMAIVKRSDWLVSMVGAFLGSGTAPAGARR